MVITKGNEHNNMNVVRILIDDCTCKNFKMQNNIDFFLVKRIPLSLAGVKQRIHFFPHPRTPIDFLSGCQNKKPAIYGQLIISYGMCPRALTPPRAAAGRWGNSQKKSHTLTVSLSSPLDELSKGIYVGGAGRGRKHIRSARVCLVN